MNEELFISVVQKYSELYNHEDPRYHDDQRRSNIWEEIAGIMNETPTACKEKWKKIRENFRKATNLRKTKSGQAAKNFKPIRYSKELRFLTPFIQSEHKSLTNLPLITSDDKQNYINSPPSTPESPAASVATTVSAKSANKKKKIGGSPTSPQSLFQSYIGKKYSHQEEEDPIVIFFKNLGQTAKQFPPDLRVRVKRAVFNVVSEAEEEFIQRNDTVQEKIPSSSISQSRNKHPVECHDEFQPTFPNTSSQTNVLSSHITSQYMTSVPTYPPRKRQSRSNWRSSFPSQENKNG